MVLVSKWQVGAHPSMPETFDGYGVLAQTNWREVWRVWTPGAITKAPSGWGEEEKICVRLKIPEG